MKSITILLTVFILSITTSYAQETFLESVATTADSVSKSVSDGVAYVDTSSTFKMLYSDIKSGLAGLAEGLKVGVEHVYIILVKQQIVKSITWIVVFILLTLSTIVVYKIYKHHPKLYIDSYGDIHPGIMFPVLYYCTIAIIFILMFCNVDTMITGFVNPEYGAIKEIMYFVKGEPEYTNCGH